MMNGNRRTGVRATLPGTLWRCVIAVAAGVVISVAQLQASASERVALVVGNASYPSAPLRNTRKDAVAMVAALERLGFSVQAVQDGTAAQIRSAIAKLVASVTDRTGVVLIYYAGHGVQLDNRNFMIPVDAALTAQSDLRTQAIDVGAATASLENSPRAIRIVILDACRDNPFRGVGSGAGLAQMDAPVGTFIAFATAPGNVASDGAATATNGVYTGALLQELENPSGSLESIFKRVRLRVRQQTHGQQIPWESTSLEREFSFDAVTSHRESDEIAFRAELAQWSRITASGRADDFYEYLLRNPNGYFAEAAQARIERLAATQPVRPVGTKAMSILPAGRPLFSLGDRFVYRERDAAGVSKANRDLTVTAVKAATVEVNGGAEVWDWVGNLIDDNVGTRVSRSPAKIWIPAELYVGKKWRTAYSATSSYGTTTLFWDFSITSKEEVSTPAGTFMTYRIAGTSEISNGKKQQESLSIDAELS